MALVIEDGSAKVNAQSYVSVADVATYGATYGLSTTHVDEPTVMRAMRYLEGNYFERWVGIKRTEDQALSWPRAWATRMDGYTASESSVPVEIKNAVCALAIRSTSDVNLTPDITRGDVAIEEEVGPIRVRYATNAPRVTIFRDIDLMLKPLLRSNGTNARVYRS